MLCIFFIMIPDRKFPYPWYFSWTTCTPNHPGLKFQILVLFLILFCALSTAVFIHILLTALLVLFTDFFCSLLTIPVAPVITGTLAEFLYLCGCLLLFLLLF